jgi:hypothetical protein
MTDIVNALRDPEGCTAGDISEAADMLAFFFLMMQIHSPKGNNQYSFVFHNGWPTTLCVGSGPQEAVRAAIRDIRTNIGE